ncbi:MAG: glycosyltransferase [Candidatus Margulisbacteria bacterium]|nr:glycosyltransferase [Candidatus Margulisiibacteriota bacterium]
MKKLKISILSEKFIGEANGVYTAFLETVDSLKKRSDVELSINENFQEADLIHAHSIGLEFIKLSFKYKKKLIISAHVVPDSFIGSLILSEWWKPLAKWYLKFVFNQAKMVIAVSPVVKSELEKIGVKTEIYVLCNSVDRNKFKPNPDARHTLRKKYNVSESQFVALCVGQIQPRKGIYDFLETARLCPDVTFIWVGGRPYGRLTADFDHLTSEVDKAPKNVIFAGIIPFEEMPEYYAMADVYFLPSYQENFAFATIEAAAVKLPLLLRDNVEYPGTLFTHYLKATDANGFSEQTKSLQNPETLQKWQSESDMLASKYEINTYIEKILMLYKKVV